MEQIDQIIGNRRDDPALADRLDGHEAQGTLERVVIAADQRKKSRLRVETDAGTDLGLVLDSPLRSGDILALGDDRAIVVEFEPAEAAVIDLPEPTSETLATAVELGHRVGNQHWDLTVQDGTVYIPVAADRRIIENVLAESLPAGTAIRYEAVDAGVWVDEPDEANHRGDHAHAEQSHGADHSHDAEHAHGPDHSHSATTHDHDHSDSTAGGDHQ